ncbi:response regulator [Variovorax sp. ZT4R33]|uniref:response regulator n=1 Tax=Variovorax sp. ZT4R33 TaxID=3443743 RepID=UPI003F47DDE0
MSIYVVDDHHMMRDAIAMVMRRLHPDLTVVELGSLAELVQRMDEAAPPRLILLDLNLPDTTGCAGVRQVKQHSPEVPLAVYSASPAADVAHDCRAAGADLYIEKTAGAVELVAALRNLLFDTPWLEPARGGPPPALS